MMRRECMKSRELSFAPGFTEVVAGESGRKPFQRLWMISHKTVETVLIVFCPAHRAEARC